MVTEADFRDDVKRRIGVTNEAIHKLHELNYSSQADILGVKSSAIHNWESNAKLNLPGPYRLYLYATRLGVSLDWLYLGDMRALAPELRKTIVRLQKQELHNHSDK